jgi:CBS-domain-containing membrane protein
MKKKILAGLLAFISLYILGLAGEVTGLRLLLAPFGASCILLFGFPHSPFIRPRSLFWGHMISSSIGIFFCWLFPGSLFLASLAVGLAMVLMLATDTFHPAAGGNPLLILHHGPGPEMLILPFLLGALYLTLLERAHRKALSS